MSETKTAILVMLKADDRDAQTFRDAIEENDSLRNRVELRFATGEEATKAATETEIIVCGNVAPETLDAAQRLRWLAFWSAGLDHKITPQITERNLIITNASGVHGPNIAEHVLAWMLMFTRRMHLHLKAQAVHSWGKLPDSRSIGADELAGQTLGIVGLGRIGENLAVRAKACEMRVLATKRNPDSRYDEDAAVDTLFGMDELPRLLAESDHVCIAVPYTPETHHLFNAETLAQMKPTAYLYNIARGKIVDEPALVTALQAGKLAGAGLDVFETEPLPKESPLWDMENVLLTPHTAGLTPKYFQRTASLFADNLTRFLDGVPMHNVYDPARGY